MGIGSDVWPDSSASPDSLQFGLIWSLWDMMNFRIGGLRTIQGEISSLLTLANANSERAPLRKTLPKGAERNERLQFLSEAAKEFFYFKDGWRNYVTHRRADYDEHQALGTLEHVRAFMNHLSKHVAEQTP
jgi:hypothetical protein